MLSPAEGCVQSGTVVQARREPPRSVPATGHLSEKKRPAVRKEKAGGRSRPPRETWKKRPYGKVGNCPLPPSTRVPVAVVFGEHRNWSFRLKAAWPTLTNAPGAVCCTPTQP